MKKSGSTEGQSASELIDKRIAGLGDWRGETLNRMRKLIKGPGQALQLEPRRERKARD